jgi:hypothetical protein
MTTFSENQMGEDFHVFELRSGPKIDGVAAEGWVVYEDKDNCAVNILLHCEGIGLFLSQDRAAARQIALSILDAVSKLPKKKDGVE